MPAIAQLLDPAAADRLALVRAKAAQRELAAAAASAPVIATCPECGQRRPVPVAVFRTAP